METLNLIEALDRLIDRVGTSLAVMRKDKPVKEAYWMYKFKMYRSAVENILSQQPDSDEVVELIRTEMKKIMENGYEDKEYSIGSKVVVNGISGTVVALYDNGNWKWLISDEEYEEERDGWVKASKEILFETRNGLYQLALGEDEKEIFGTDRAHLDSWTGLVSYYSSEMPSKYKLFMKGA